MKLREEFRVDQPAADVWEFFEQPELVARCIPGVEQIRVIDPDNVQVRITQSIGPMSATFEAKVIVIEREPLKYIRFQAAGKSVRGAVGNIRTDNAVHLIASDDATTVSVEGDVIMAGALGSVGQKVVAKQAGKVTAAFAENLRRALAGEEPATAAHPATPAPGAPSSQAAPAGGGWVEVAPGPSAAPSGERWAKVAVALSAVSAIFAAFTFASQRRGQR